MGKKVPVSERALFARINRALAKDGEGLRRCRRNSRAWPELGDYYVINVNKNWITGKQIDLEGYGRELKVLADFEELSED
jgi:hypothetical protein